MKRIIAGGTGFIGHALVNHWCNHGFDIYVLGRDKQKINQCFGDSVTPLDWTEFKQNHAALLKDCDAIINLAGVNIAGKRWTKRYKEELISSRVDSTNTIAEACAVLGENSPRLLNASAIGIYGLQQELDDNLPLPYDENSEISTPPKDFLSTIARAWERATEPAKGEKVNVVNLRFAVVLDKSGGALPKMATPFYFFAGGRVGSGNQAFSWISLHDLCRVFDFILQHPEISGPINCVALRAIKQVELAKALGRVLHRPSFIPTPAFALRLLLGRDRANELLLKGQHVVPMRLSMLGFHFDHPDIDTALRSMYG